jgi:hypothetical protein
VHSSKHFLIGLLSIVFACGTVGLVAPLASEAKLKKKPAFSQAPLVKKIFKKTVCGFRNPQDRFVTSKDGTEVCDRTTGDIWEQNPDSNNRGILSQPEAIEFCATLDKGHGKAYELPSIQQLVSVLDYTEYSPALTPGCSLTSVRHSSGRQRHLSSLYLMEQRRGKCSLISVVMCNPMTRQK